MDISTKAEDQESIKSVVVKTKDRVAVRKEIAMGYLGSAAMQRIKNSVMRRNPSPCKDCAERHLRCHSECNLYSDWQREVSDKTHDIFVNYSIANCGAKESKKRHNDSVAYKQNLRRKGQR